MIPELDRTYLTLETDRPFLLRRASPETIYLHHNGSTSGWSPETLRQLSYAIQAILSGSFDRAHPESLLAQPSREAAAHPSQKAAPTLEQL
jgi:hypothetical protein